MEQNREPVYSTDLSTMQAILVRANLDGLLCRLRKYDPIDILNGIAYVVKTGCQWAMLPKEFPHWESVYHHFRSLSERGWFDSFLKRLVEGRRAALGQPTEPCEAVVDSQSVRSAIPDSEKGVDGHKKVKGIKRHIAVDDNGYVLCANVTAANVNDSKGAIPLVPRLMTGFCDVEVIKADKAYVALGKLSDNAAGIRVECVKSNYGTAEFRPLHGRWVVERNFSWMDNSRRLTRNYERRLKVARQMFIAACVFFMLRYFR